MSRAAAAAGCRHSADHSGDKTATQSSTTSSSSSASWLPPYYGAAQPAVDTLTALLSAYSKATMSKPTSAAPQFDRFVVGRAKQEFDDAYAGMRKRGVVYRGTPDQPRILVSKSQLGGQLPNVTLTNCPLISTTDPPTAYSIKTGAKQPVSPDDLTSFLQTAIVVQVSGRWAVTAFATDTSKACTR